MSNVQASADGEKDTVKDCTPIEAHPTYCALLVYRLATITVYVLSSLQCMVLYSQQPVAFDLTSEPSSVLVSRNGLYAAYSSDDLFGIVVRNVHDWSVHSRLGKPGGDLGLAMMAHGFLNDTVLVVTAFNMPVFYNIHTGERIDTTRADFFYAAFLSSTSVLLGQSIGPDADSTLLYRYTLHSGTEPEYCLAVPRGTRIYSTPESPCIILRRGSDIPVVVDKLTMDTTAKLSGARELNYRHPFTFCDSGTTVYAWSGDNAVSKYRLEDGSLIRTVKIQRSFPTGADPSYGTYVSSDEQHIGIIQWEQDSRSVMGVYDIDGSEALWVDVLRGTRYHAITWLEESEKFFFSTDHSIHLFDINDVSHPRLVALRRYEPEIYMTCDRKSAVITSEHDNSLRVDFTTSDVVYLDYEQWVLIATVHGRLKGSDSLLLNTGYGVSPTDFCSPGWPIGEEIAEVDAKKTMITKNRQWIIGLADDHQHMRIINTNTREADSIELPAVGELLNLSFVDSESAVLILGELGVAKVNLTSREVVVVRSGSHSWLDRDLVGRWADTQGRFAVVLDGRYSVTVLDLESGSSRNIPTTPPERNNVLWVDMHPSGEYLALAEESGLVRLISTRTHEEMDRIELTGFHVERSGWPTVASIRYDVETRSLESVNWYGELIAQIWPIDPVSAVEVDATAGPARTGVHVRLMDSAIEIGTDGVTCVSSVQVYSLIGTLLYSATNNTCVDGMRLALPNEYSGPAYCVIQALDGVHYQSIFVSGH